MRTAEAGQLLRIYVGESDTWRGRPVYQAIVERARRDGLAGATVTRGIYGYGAGRRIHRARSGRISEDVPAVIEIADTPDRISAFMPVLDEMMRDGLVTLAGAELFAYR